MRIPYRPLIRSQQGSKTFVLYHACLLLISCILIHTGTVSGAMATASSTLGLSAGTTTTAAPPRYSVHSQVYRDHIGETLSCHKAKIRTLPKEIKVKEASNKENLQLAKQKGADIEAKKDQVSNLQGQIDRLLADIRVDTGVKEEYEGLAAEDLSEKHKLEEQLAISTDVVEEKNQRFKDMSAEEFHKDQGY